MTLTDALVVELHAREADSSRSVDILKEILENGRSQENTDLDKQVQDAFGNPSTLLCLACRAGDHYAAELLIKHGASVDLVNEDGQFPLIIALEKKHSKLITVLCQYGANPLKVYTKTRMSAYDMVQEDIRQEELVALRSGEGKIVSDSPLLQSLCFGFGQSILALKSLIGGTLKDFLGEKNTIDTMAYFIAEYAQPDYINGSEDLKQFQMSLSTLPHLNEQNASAEEVLSAGRVGRDMQQYYVGEHDGQLGMFSSMFALKDDDDEFSQHNRENDADSDIPIAGDLMHSMYSSILNLVKSVLPPTSQPPLFGSVGFDYETYYTQQAEEQTENANSWLHNLVRGIEPEPEVESEVTNLLPNDDEIYRIHREEKEALRVAEDQDEDSEEDWMTPQVCVEDGGFSRSSKLPVKQTKSTGSGTEDVQVKVLHTVSPDAVKSGSLWAQMEEGMLPEDEE